FKTPAVPAYSLASGPNLRSSVTGALGVARQSHVARTARRNNNLPRLLVGVSPGCGLPVMGSNQPGAPGPLIFCAEDSHGHFRRIRIRRNAMVEQIFGRLLHLDIARERCHDGLADAFRAHY